MTAPISLVTSSTPLPVTFLVLPSGPPMTETAVWCFSNQAFQAAIPSRSLARLSASRSAIHIFMRGLVLLPRKTARYVSFVLIGFPFVCTQGRSGGREPDNDVQKILRVIFGKRTRHRRHRRLRPSGSARLRHSRP